MELKQRTELRKLLVPQLQASLKVLTLSIPELKNLVEEELANNPLLLDEPAPTSYLQRKAKKKDLDFTINLLTQKASLQDILLRQLSMFTETDEDLKIGQEIIGNIDENGYLKASLDEIRGSLGVDAEKIAKVLKLIQQFEPAGVGARTIPECLLIQFNQNAQDDPLTTKIIEFHLDDVAKKNYTLIAKTLKEPLKNIESSIKKILKLDPKPGRNYSQDEIQNVIPDVIIEEKDEELEAYISNEDIPNLSINKEYKEMIKDKKIDQETKEFLKTKLRTALELLRSLNQRQRTLRKVVDVIMEIQAEAIRENISHLKPLNFQEVAQKIGMHESTVCRVVMNKYVQTPHGVLALKDFFPSRIHGQNGDSVSSNFVKGRIKELLDKEDKKHPLSDQEITAILEKENALKVARRTVAKYREELKILSTAFRRER